MPARIQVVTLVSGLKPAKNMIDIKKKVERNRQVEITSTPIIKKRAREEALFLEYLPRA